MVVISLVRNNKRGDIGFLKMQNRINVLLSRAQHGMYLLGHLDTLLAGSGTKAPMWGKVLATLAEGGLVQSSFQVWLVAAWGTCCMLGCSRQHGAILAACLMQPHAWGS